VKWDQKAPCASCPYRKEVPTGIWDGSEYVKLLDQDHPGGAVFLCHLSGGKPKSEERLCVGWLLDQKKRDLPNLALRIRLIAEAGAAKLWEELTDEGLELYESILAMVWANTGKAFPSRHPLAKKLKKMKRR
jgi:hypothetical protein